jgi:hypothetical protein
MPRASPSIRATTAGAQGVLYRRGGLSHALSHGLSHGLSHDLPGSGPIVPPAREGRRRRFSEAGKRQILREAMRPDSRFSEVARRYGIAERVLFRWKQEMPSRSPDEGNLIRTLQVGCIMILASPFELKCDVVKLSKWCRDQIQDVVAGDRIGQDSRHKTLGFPAIIELGSWRRSSFVS